MFEIGDRVRVTELGPGDELNGVTIGAAGTIVGGKDVDWSKLVQFDLPARVRSVVASPGSNQRWVDVDRLEPELAAPKRRGFQVGDCVVVVRGGKPVDLEELYGCFGVIKDAFGTMATVEFKDWGDGWESLGNDSDGDCWGIHKCNLRRVVSVHKLNG